MLYAIELFLDDRADRQVRRIWAALDAGGVPSLASAAGADSRPHVSLSVFDCEDVREVAAQIGPVLATASGVSLPLASLGFFVSDESPMFLGVIPSPRLLELHGAVHEAVEPLVEEVWPYYRPGSLMPHCTLAMRVADRARAHEIAARFPVPITAHATSARIVAIPGGRIVSAE
jgi:2'-5' RNA ligase